jgi:L,D-peptidoglycan transpeptidase YkuD (ErfK/YbiS/YcfS/YnhG family)
VNRRGWHAGKASEQSVNHAALEWAGPGADVHLAETTHFLETAPVTPPAATRTRRWHRLLVAGVVATFPLLTPGLLQAPAATAASAVPAFAERVPAATTQVVRTVRTNRWCGRVYCTKTQAWEKSDGAWRLATLPSGAPAVFRSTIGARGFAPEGRRREGTNTSPTGVFTIKVTFSTGPANPGQMPWRRRLPTSSVTNYPGRLYNTWIEERGRTDGDRPSMRYGFWVGYNNPRFRYERGPMPVPGIGSGIFYHTSRPGHEYAPTEGCTQVGRPAKMRWIVQWLRPGADPRVANNV